LVWSRLTQNWHKLEGEAETIFVIASVLLEIAVLAGAELDGELRHPLFVGESADRSQFREFSFVTDGDLSALM
jgi:hypothetical protein